MNKLINIHVSRDGQEALLTITPPPAPTEEDSEQIVITKNDVYEFLNKEGIVYGIIDNGIDEALAMTGKAALVARGTPPQDGENGYIEYFFIQPNKKQLLMETEDGRVDFRKLNLIHNVRKGELLAKKIPPTKGKDGISVKKTPILAKPGKLAILPKGKNTETNENQDILTAKVAGHVSIIDNKVNILPVFEIRGNVDYSTGNIDFIGDVIIMGNVCSNFEVKAEGNIEIRGNIEEAKITAGNDLMVNKGITGGEKTDIKVGGNMYVRFIENAKVEVQGNCTINDHILSSRLRCQGSVYVQTGKGAIMGGHIQAKDEVVAKTIGSQSYIQTVVETGLDPEIKREYLALKNKLSEMESLQNNIRMNIDSMSKTGIDPDKLTAKKKADLVNLIQKHNQYNKEIAYIKKQADEHEQFLTTTGGRGKIKVLDAIHPGVRIIIGQAILDINDLRRTAEFGNESGEVVIR